jgi:hypothetical protein
MNLGVRESRDSVDHPESLSIIFALDVTGSMGGIPKQLAQETLPNFMKSVIQAGIPHPQILFLAMGDAQFDDGPLQVGQFESSDELMDQWLTRVWLEGGGGGNGHESYDLGFYVAARHTAIDCHERRGQKGYLIMTGDEKPYPAVEPAHVRRTLGLDLEAPLPLEDLIEELQTRWEPFYLIPSRQRDAQCGEIWRRYLGHRVIVLDDPQHIALTAASLIALHQGALATLDELGAQLRRDGVPGPHIQAVIDALMPFADAIGRAGHADVRPDPSPADTPRTP